MIMTARESPEYLAIKKHFIALKGAVIRGEVRDGLFERDLITPDVMRLAINENVGQDKRGKDVMMDVLDAVRLKPAMFDDFCDALALEEALTGEIVQKMRGSYSYILALLT